MMELKEKGKKHPEVMTEARDGSGPAGPSAGRSTAPPSTGGTVLGTTSGCFCSTTASGEVAKTGDEMMKRFSCGLQMK